MKLFDIPNNICGGVMSPWLSNTSVLRFGDDGRLYSFDIPTKTQMCLERFTNQVQSSPAHIIFLDASPDGKFAMWGRSGGNPIFASPIDGSQRHQWPNVYGLTSPHWCADSKHIAQVAFSGGEYENGLPTIRFDKVDFRDVETGETSETITELPAGLQGLEILTVASASHVVARAPNKRKALQTIQTSPSSFLGASIETTRTRQEFSVWNLYEANPRRQWTIDMPGEVLSLCVSSHTDQIAWHIKGAAEGTSKSQTQLWISAIDGSGLRKIAIDAGSIIGATIRWSPNGRMLSFVVGSEFHVVELAAPGNIRD